MANRKNQSAPVVREDTFRGNSVRPLTKAAPKNSGDKTPRPKQ